MSDFTSLSSSTSSTESTKAFVLEQTLRQVPSAVKEAIFYVSVPFSYDVPLLAALRDSLEGSNDKLAISLQERLSFIELVHEHDGQLPHYQMHPAEREWVQRRFIEDNAEQYLDMHQRTLRFWQANPAPDPYTQEQYLVYHLLFVDLEAGTALLGQTFRRYANIRHLVAIDRLLDTAKEAYPYLAALEKEGLETFETWLSYLQTRLIQLRGQWPQSGETLERLLRQTTLPLSVKPYVLRAYGLVLAKTGHTPRVEALDYLHDALAIFKTQEGTEAEQGYTMVALGDTYVELAVTTRGYRERVVPVGQGWFGWLRNLFYLPLLLPLVWYLNAQGIRLWHPSSWHVLQKQDWIIARLFGLGVQWYMKANVVLQAQPERSEWWGRPEEKQAWLYLTLGDARQALTLFQELLTNTKAPLSEYTTASVQTGLGWCWLRLEAPHQALTVLEEAWIKLEKYEDLELQAQAQRLLAEALLQCGEGDRAVQQFGKALQLYQTYGDLVGATDVTERLWEIEGDEGLSLETTSQKELTRLKTSLAVNQYLVRFQHPMLVRFRRLMMVALALLIMLLPMVTIQIEQRSLLNPHLVFSVLSPMGMESSSFALNTISQFRTIAVPAISLYDAVGVRVLFSLLCLVAAAYSYTRLGAYMIARIDLKALQAESEAEALRIDEEGITVGMGSGQLQQMIRWADITQVIIGEIRWISRPMRNHSFLLLDSADEQLLIRGNTAWYEALRSRFISSLSTNTPSVQIIDFSYTVLWSKLGVLYGLGLASWPLFVFLNRLWPVWSNQKLAFLGYSIVDLYPYLFLALLLPPLWWGMIRPLWILARIGAHRVYLQWVGSIGLVLGLLRLLTYRYDWFFFPDIYPSLGVLVLLGTVIVTFQLARHPVVAVPVSPRLERDAWWPLKWRVGLSAWAERAILLLMALLMVISGARLVKDVWAYDEIVRAGGELAEFSEQAVERYTHALALDSLNVMALRGRAVAYTQQEAFPLALKDYNEALRYVTLKAPIYSDRAITYQNWGMSVFRAEPEKANQHFDEAMKDFEEAIEREPNNPDYHLWRGMTNHITMQWDDALASYQDVLDLGPDDSVPTQMNKGWLYLQKGDQLTIEDETHSKSDQAPNDARASYQQALTIFQTVAQEVHSPELSLAMGYTHFRLGQETEALASWEAATTEEPTTMVGFLSRGTAHWSLATWEGEPCVAVSDDPTTQARQEQGAAHIEAAIADFTRVLTFASDDISSHQTLAQLHYLLRYCPGYTYERELVQAITALEQAIALEPDDLLLRQALVDIQEQLER